MFAILSERGQVALGEGHYAEAADFYRRAALLDPHDSEVTYALARCERALGHVTEADLLLARGKEIDADVNTLLELHKEIGKKPGDPELRYRASRICARNGQKAEARRWLLSVLRLNPHHRLAREALASD